MKYVVSFFKEGLQKIQTISVIAIVLIIIFVFMFNTNIGMKSIVCFGTDIRQAEKINFDIKDVAKIYPIYNQTSYILKESEIKEKASKEEKSTGNEAGVYDSNFNVASVDTTEVVSTKTNVDLSVKNTEGLQKINIYGTSLLNYSSKRNIDFGALFKRNITLTKKSDPIFIYTTHTSESYANSDRFKFGYSGTYRSRDAKYNMLAIATVMDKALREKGMSTIFSTTPHDYGSYEIAYTNSRRTFESVLKENGRVGIAIDMHRDAKNDLTYAPTVQIKGKKVAQLMFVMGVGTDKYKNEYWEANLALAIQLQKLGEEMYPGLFKPMIIRNSKYNQDLTKNSFLIEVGATGNTIEEASLGARCLANILNKYYNN